MDTHAVVVLRFRDLVTERGGTIEEHRRIQQTLGSVWWGWWMRQYESPPRELFESIASTLDSGVEPRVYLFDTGRTKIYLSKIIDIRVALPGETIGPPDLSAAPEYYQRGAYPAWFKLGDIVDVEFSDTSWVYASFPTRPDYEALQITVDQSVESLEQLRETDATLWLMREASSS